MCETAIDNTEQTLTRLLAALDTMTGARNDALHDQARASLEDFLHVAATLSSRQWEKIQSEHAALPAYEDKLRAVYARYIRQREQEEAERLLDHGARAEAGVGGITLEDFGRRIYERVRDLFDRLDLTSCGRFVMVGCGPLPGTLLNVMENTAIPQIIGLDNDKLAVSTVNRLADRFGLTRLRAVHGDGGSYDYRDADVVYVANLVRGKSKVLCRIADTLKDGADVVLRDPYSVGEMFAESGRRELDPKFVVTGEGKADAEFWSNHVFMRKRAD